MRNPNVHTLDLNFKGVPSSIGVFLIPHQAGGILIECGPGSTIPAVVTALSDHNLTPQDITDVFVTHIHLDHAGAAGWWARQGATIHVHNFGARHLLNPEKLIASATRIYGDQMDTLWGEFLPVPAEKLNQLSDGDCIEIEELNIKALDTPGHARHHMSYLVNNICFTGDVGGCRLPGIKSIRLPSVPPEFNIETWRQTIHKLQREDLRFIAPTHFGLHPDPNWHLAALAERLDEIETWVDTNLPHISDRETLREQYAAWVTSQDQALGVPADLIAAYDIAISSEMSADGIWRYWHKFKAEI
jgi:glyoxylase-like metal-dependent hydrolase (beta-lactamase superfamily II)